MNPICGKPFQKGILDGEATVCGRNPFHVGACGKWTASTERDGDTITIMPETRVHDPGDRFSEDTLGADGKAFIAVAMEWSETRVQVAPFSVSIEVEAARSKLTLSFENPNAALVWITDLRGEIPGHLRALDDEPESVPGSPHEIA